MKESFLIAGSVCLALLFILIASTTHTNQPTISLPTIPEATHMLATIGATQFDTKNSQEQRTIIDVRTPAEYAEGHIAGAKNIDIYAETFEEELAKLNRAGSYSVYCRSGNRSGQALQIMESMGFTDVIDLEGGIGAWAREGKSLCLNC